MRVQILLAGGGGQADARAIARQRLRHGFIRGAHRSALGIELWIVLIGLGQRPFQRVGRRRPRRQRQQSRHRRDRDGRPIAAPDPDCQATKAHVHAPRTTRNTHGTPDATRPHTRNSRQFYEPSRQPGNPRAVQSCTERYARATPSARSTSVAAGHAHRNTNFG